MTTKAFIVGIDDYMSPGINDLHGCVKDAQDMANTLMILGFDSRKIKISTNRRATKENILKGIQWLLKDCKKNDCAVFYYAGHGSQITDIHDEDEEKDHKDEILCPADFNMGDEKYITDDDLKKLFKNVEGFNLEIILDCCHSGSGTRELTVTPVNPPIQQTVQMVKARYMPPPLDYSFHLQTIPNLRKRRLLKSGCNTREFQIVEGLNHIMWAACRDNQVSEETFVNGAPRGVFTFNFCEILRRSNGQMPREKVESLLTNAIARAGFVQIPQLEASSEELLHDPFR